MTQWMSIVAGLSLLLLVGSSRAHAMPKDVLMDLDVCMEATIVNEASGGRFHTGPDAIPYLIRECVPSYRAYVIYCRIDGADEIDCAKQASFIATAVMQRFRY